MGDLAKTISEPNWAKEEEEEGDEAAAMPKKIR
jgi:hypothetical protein